MESIFGESSSTKGSTPITRIPCYQTDPTTGTHNQTDLGEITSLSCMDEHGMPVLALVNAKTASILQGFALCNKVITFRDHECPSGVLFHEQL